MSNKLNIALKDKSGRNPVVQSMPNDLNELANKDVRSEWVACVEKAVRREFELSDMDFEVKRGEGAWEFITLSLLLLQLSKQGNNTDSFQNPTLTVFKNIYAHAV